MTAPGIDPAKVVELAQREDTRYLETHTASLAMWERAKPVMPNGVPMSWHRMSYDPIPMFVDEARGSHFRDVDGNDYADFNIADMSMFAGYGPEPVVEAVARRIAQGSQFMLPSEDSIWVAEELGRRYGLPTWQFTLSATHANTEAIRIARTVTGRDKVLFFDGKYHGHFDEVLIELEDGELVAGEVGLPADTASKTEVVQFNDADAVSEALERREIAIVITEPVITNNVGLLMPEEGFHDRLRAITRATGTLLAYDETHTQVVGPGGFTRMWDLDPDLLIVGKSLAGGLPMGAYGMTREVAEVLERPAGRDDEKPLVATGGTLFGNPLQMASARATMEHVLTPDAYEHTQILGAQLADGIEAVIDKAGLDWTTHRFWPRSGVTFAPSMARNALEAYASFDEPLRRLARVFMANRGVWDAIVGAGPTCAVPASEADVDTYVETYRELVGELTR
jgi:glutamate-1-semialdehyde 2,1-aminomutase